MATDSLIIKDGAGSTKSLSVFSSSYGFIPEHVISGTVVATASAANPIYVTGAVSISQPVSVDVVVGDNIFVTSSLTDPLYVSSSANSPLLVTGTVALQSNQITSSISGVTAITGSVGISGTALVALENNQTITASIANTPTVIIGGSPSVTSSLSAPLYVSSSINSPLLITGTVALPNNLVTASITSSDSSPVIVKQKTGLDTIRAGFSVFSGDINWASTGSSNVSGTFILANSSSTRTSLMFSNNNSVNLYVVFGDNDNSNKNGFGMNSTSSAPYSYSFILFPSGTYFAEPAFVGVKHSGFFVSASAAADALITVYKIE